MLKAHVMINKGSISGLLPSILAVVCVPRPLLRGWCVSPLWAGAFQVKLLEQLKRLRSEHQERGEG